jgi:hypothetical protein
MSVMDKMYESGNLNQKPNILWEDHRLRVFQNRALRRILGPKRDEVTGG